MFISLCNKKWEKSYSCNIKHDALLNLKHFSIILFLLEKEWMEKQQKLLEIFEGI